MRRFLTTILLLVFFGTGWAQEPPAYGPPIGLETAKKVMDAAEAEAVKNNWQVVIVIVDSGGHLVMLHKIDHTQLGSIQIAQDKARTAVHFRRETKSLEERLAQGGADLKLLALDAAPMEGGLPIIVDGKIIGGIGVSGVRSDQDAEVGRAGLKALE